MECNNNRGGDKMVRALPTIELDDKVYFIDERLRELRNINNPHDSRPLDDMYKKEEVR
jgi:hypothetical protein